ncbi:MAG: hypothetical protein K0R17_3101 [Rariglobus sp.]|jgi:cytochrome b subunit of formate dehydrogenase|nr:hypothetical protein [Rariglobus sp.]
MRASSRSGALARVAKAQGWFYLVSGAWPWISGESFQAVTGRKADFWLAQTVGLLLAITGVVLLLAARANRITREIMLLGALQAGALMVVDVYCVFQPRTTHSYLLDCVVELGIVIAWCLAARAATPPSTE